MRAPHLIGERDAGEPDGPPGILRLVLDAGGFLAFLVSLMILIGIVCIIAYFLFVFVKLHIFHSGPFILNGVNRV